MTQPIFLGAVVIHSTNGGIRITENAVALTATIAAGTYYLRGDGDPDDLCLAIKTALEAAGASPNTYSVTPFFVLEGSTIHSSVVIARATGSHTISLNLGDALTTFDVALVGFLAQTYSGDTSYNSDLPCAAVWVSNDHLRECEPFSSRDATVTRAQSGKVRGVTRSDRMQSWRVGLAFVAEARMSALAASVLLGEANALEAFVERFGAGAQFELHEIDEPDGTATSGDLDGTTLIGTMHFSEETLESFSPQRLGPGIALYSIDLVTHAVVA